MERGRTRPRHAAKACDRSHPDDLAPAANKGLPVLEEFLHLVAGQNAGGDDGDGVIDTVAEYRTHLVRRIQRSLCPHREEK